MIFSNKVYKLAQGTNPSFFPIDSQTTQMYVFSGLSGKKIISYLSENFVRCYKTNEKYSYNKLIKINNNFSAVCFDKNVSIIKNNNI